MNGAAEDRNAIRRWTDLYNRYCHRQDFRELVEATHQHQRFGIEHRELNESAGRLELNMLGRTFYLRFRSHLDGGVIEWGYVLEPDATSDRRRDSDPTASIAVDVHGNIGGGNVSEFESVCSLHLRNLRQTIEAALRPER